MGRNFFDPPKPKPTKPKQQPKLHLKKSKNNDDKDLELFLEAIEGRAYHTDRYSSMKLDAKIKNSRDARRQLIKPKMEKYRNEPLGFIKWKKNAMLICKSSSNENQNTEGEDFFSALPLFIKLNILEYLDLFEDMLFASTCRMMHSLYMESNRHRNNMERAGYYYALWAKEMEKFSYGNYGEKYLDVEKQIFEYAHYSVVVHMAEICWTDILPFSAGDHTLRHASLALAMTPRPNFLTSLPHIWPLITDNNTRYPGAYARYIVVKQPMQFIDILFVENMENPEVEELLACIVGELIVCNLFHQATENIKSFYLKMKSFDHPLARLSSSLLPIELGIKSGKISLQKVGDYSFARLPDSKKLFPDPPELPKNVIKNALDKNRKRFEVIDRTTMDDALELKSAVKADRSSGRVFEVQNLSSPLDGQDILSVLVDTNCVKYVDEKDNDIQHCKLITANEAFGNLVCQAANWISDQGTKGAYARVAAWQTLAAIVGVKYKHGLELIEKEAKKCTFLYFWSKGNKWKDTTNGLGVLRSDKATVVSHKSS